MPAAIAAPVRAEKIGLEWRGGRTGCRNRTGSVLLRLTGLLPGFRNVCLDLAHGVQQGFFPLLDGGFAIRLEEFPDVPYKVRIRQYAGPVSSRCSAHAVTISRSIGFVSLPSMRRGSPRFKMT